MSGLEIGEWHMVAELLGLNVCLQMRRGGIGAASLGNYRTLGTSAAGEVGQDVGEAERIFDTDPRAVIPAADVGRSRVSFRGAKRVTRRRAQPDG